MVFEAIFPTYLGYVSIERWSQIFVPGTRSARNESEKNPRSLTNMAFSSLSVQAIPSAWNENLRPLLNRNIPLISGKYGLKNHFDQESGFLMRKNEKKGPEAMKPLLSHSIGQHGYIARQPYSQIANAVQVTIWL